VPTLAPLLGLSRATGNKAPRTVDVAEDRA
jgi:hypothetical protein